MKFIKNFISVRVSSVSTMENFKFYLRVYACCSIGLTTGSANSWTSPVLAKLTLAGNEYSSEPITATQAFWITSLLFAGASIAPFATYFTLDRYGRLRTLQLFAVPALAAYIAMAFVPSLWCLYLARFVIGLGMGCMFSALPLYLAEISEPKNRGEVGCVLLIFICVGIFFSFAVGPYVKIWMFCLMCSVPYIIFLISSLTIIPESPQFLVAVKGQRAGEEALMKLRQKPQDDVQKELTSILLNNEQIQNTTGGFKDLFKQRPLFRTLLISIGMMLFQQLAGITIILSYLQTIFISASSSLSPEYPPMIIAAVQLFTAVASSFITDKVGRRILLLISCLGACISHSSLAVYFYLRTSNHDVSSIGWLPIASLVAFIIVFNLGLASLPWTILGELFPVNVKAAASTLSTSSCLAFATLMAIVFPLMSEAIGMANSFFMFSLFCVAAAVFVWFCIPETKGKSLDEIQELIRN